ncbi:MAG: ATP-binding cassette domain-containing protein [Gammaproteobacteria bacterium]|nr:ATP-binding cassette domain-containing protein [Gammaproteobacteria bacterium]
MLNFKDLSLRRGIRELLHDVSVTFYPGQRVGITGANGVGKSSLFALIREELHPDTGDYFITQGTIIAHVSQETPAVQTPAIEYVKDGDTGLRILEENIRQAESNNDGELLAHLYADMEAIEGYSANSRAGRLMHGLGFTSAQEQLPVSTFSGGWRMRLNLAQALMCRSDLLLLDEPTNHLDLETVIWLEEWLRAYEGLLLLISHDRDFLDSVTTHIAHIEHERLRLYTGNYSAFELLRAEQLANQQAQYEKQQRQIQHMQKFVERFRAKASKATQAQSRVKALERMTVIGQAHVDSPFDFSFKKADSLPDPLLRLEHASVGYDDNVIVRDINLNIVIGDRIGLLGHNGAGKSTLIKLLAGELGCMQGERMPAKGIQIGYFAQHQLEQLDGEASPLLHLQRIDPKASEQHLRSYLGGFSFQGDMATASVAPFSGGEKARLVLAMLVYQKPNFLLLDEPTNHLDLEMRLALTTALQDFEGAMIVVSHDRHLLRTVADTLLLVADGSVAEFDGDLDDYRKLVREKENEDQKNMAEDSTGINKKQLRKQAAEQRLKLKPLKNKIQKLEKQMDKFNLEKTKLHEQLADSVIYEDENKEKLKMTLACQGDTEQSLQKIEEEWLLLQDELEQLEQ